MVAFSRIAFVLAVAGLSTAQSFTAGRPSGLPTGLPPHTHTGAHHSGFPSGGLKPSVPLPSGPVHSGGVPGNPRPTIVPSDVADPAENEKRQASATPPLSPRPPRTRTRTRTGAFPSNFPTGGVRPSGPLPSVGLPLPTAEPSDVADPPENEKRQASATPPSSERPPRTHSRGMRPTGSAPSGGFSRGPRPTGVRPSGVRPSIAPPSATPPADEDESPEQKRQETPSGTPPARPTNAHPSHIHPSGTPPPKPSGARPTGPQLSGRPSRPAPSGFVTSAIAA